MNNKFLNKLSSFLFYCSILIFIIAFNFAHNPPGGWYQQFLPQNLPAIKDITFQDSLTGYAVTALSSDNKSYVIKTSNGGDNWNVVLTDSSGRNFNGLEFLDANTGFAFTDWFAGSAKLYKTIDGGINWTVLNNPPTNPSYLDLSVLTENELWTVDNIAFDGGVFRTTNGGTTWQRKYYNMSFPADRIYMVNSRIGFISDGDNSNSYLRKTTNSGDNWIEIPNGDGWYSITFQDSLIGWRALATIQNFQKTTDGGLSWVTLLKAINGNPTTGINSFKILNDTIWGVYFGSNILYPNNQFRGIIFRSTNSGLSWGYQLPDTSIQLCCYYFLNFPNSNYGWAYTDYTGGVHTVTGGDTITYPLTSIFNNNNTIPDKYKLFQNFPNPFNPKTNIGYEINTANIITIKVFDINGKEVKTLVNKKQSAGKYNIEFDGSDLSSGVYFYSLLVENSVVETKRMLLIK